MRHRHRCALVTGSTRGIGLAIATELAAAGHHLMLNGFGDAQVIEAIRAELARIHGIDVLYDSADVGQPQAIESMMERAARQSGGIDVLVNYAGIQHVAPVDEFPPDRWNAIVAINLSAAFHTTRQALAHMKFNRWGRIVNVSSAHALVASPFKSAYVAAKHGIAGFSKSVALEVADSGITVNAVCPGYLLTPLVRKQIPDTARTRGISEDQVVQDVLLAAQLRRHRVRPSSHPGRPPHRGILRVHRSTHRHRGVDRGRGRGARPGGHLRIGVPADEDGLRRPGGAAT